MLLPLPPKAVMLKKPTILQYALFALVAAAAIAFYIADAAAQYQYIWHGHERASSPAYFDLSNQVVSASDPALKAGLHEGDRVLTVNGEPLRSFDTLLQQTNASRPGDPMTLVIDRNDGSRGTVQFPLAPQITGGSLSVSFKLILSHSAGHFPCFLSAGRPVGADGKTPGSECLVRLRHSRIHRVLVRTFELLERAGPCPHGCL